MKVLGHNGGRIAGSCKFVVGILLVSVESQELPCGEPGLQPFRVASTSDATKLSEAFNCSDGHFSVDWHGHVHVNETITVGSNTSLTVTGGVNSSAVVDGGGTTRLFKVAGGELHLSNIQLSNGYAENGGAVHVSAGSMSWTGQVSFTDNVAEVDGGAIRCLSCTLDGIGQTLFSNNTARDDGGAIRMKQGTMTAAGNTTFLQNTAEATGGAVFATYDSNIEFTGYTSAIGHSAILGGAFAVGWDSPVGETEATLIFKGTSAFTDNSATEQGGAFWISQGCYVSLEGSILFADNKAAGDGGAVTMYSDSGLNLSADSTGGIFVRNVAGRAGGAVFSTGYAQVQTYVNVVFEDNTAASGGAISTSGAGPQSSNNFTNCTFMGNQADAKGGAVETGYGNDVYRNTSFYSNSADAGGACSLVGGTARYDNVTFRENWAVSEGPAVTVSGGFIDSMTDVVFDGNIFRCSAHYFLEYIDDEEDEESSARYLTVCNGCPGDGYEYVDVRDPLDMDCSPALEHTEAEFDTIVETLDIASGYWRATATSMYILQCYNAAACLGGQTGDINFCEEGYTGPYCAVCERGSGILPYTCKSCSGSELARATTVAAMMMLIALVMVALVVADLMSTEPHADRNGGLHYRLLHVLPLQSFKILVVVWQILTQFSEAANVTFPETYEWFLGFVGAINFDASWLVSAGCLWSEFDHHDRLLMNTIWPLVALAFLGATCFMALKKASGSAVEETQTRVLYKHVSAVLLLTFFVYSSVSSNIFQMFACENLDDGNLYLRADYRIQCDSTKHRVLQAYAGVMILVYPLGIPVLYAVLFYRLRDVLSTKGAGQNWRARATAGIRAPYRPARYYYEVIECMRRIMLTGVVVFIYPGDAAQIVISMMFAFIFFAVFEALSPYESASDMWLSRGGHIVVFFSFFAGLLYKINVSDESDTSQQVFSGAMIAVHVCLIGIVVFNGAMAWFSGERVAGEDILPRCRNVELQARQNRSPAMTSGQVGGAPAAQESQ